MDSQGLFGKQKCFYAWYGTTCHRVEARSFPQLFVKLRRIFGFSDFVDIEVREGEKGYLVQVESEWALARDEMQLHVKKSSGEEWDPQLMKKWIGMTSLQMSIYSMPHNRTTINNITINNFFFGPAQVGDMNSLS